MQGRDRGELLRARRLQPQLPDRRRRHRQLRACRLFRPRRLCSRPSRDQARLYDGTRTAGGATDRGARGGAVRLLHRAAVRHLSRHADARVRADRLRGRLPVGGGDGRRQRRRRRVAVALGGRPHGLLLPGACGQRGRHRAAAAGASTRPSATPCARRATRWCAPTPSASTCARIAGWHSSWRVRRRGWPAASLPSPRAPSIQR